MCARESTKFSDTGEKRAPKAGSHEKSVCACADANFGFDAKVLRCVVQRMEHLGNSTVWMMQL